MHLCRSPHSTLGHRASGVVQVWAVRENVSEMVYKRHALQLRPFVYYQTTAVLVAVAYGLSVVVPSVWALVSLVGFSALKATLHPKYSNPEAGNCSWIFKF